jgi:hypothetical protein
MTFNCLNASTKARSKRAIVGFLAALVLVSTPLGGTAETIRRDFHYRTRGMVRLLFFWVGKNDVGGGRISFLESRADQGDQWTRGVEVLFGSRPDRVPGGHNRWGYAKELAHWRSQGSEGAVLDSVRFEGFMTLAHEKSLSEVENADKSVALYEGTVSIVGTTQAEARLWRFRGSREDTYQNPDNVSNQYVAIRDTKPFIERTLQNEDAYSTPYGFLTAVHAFVEEALRAEASDVVLSSVEGEKPYVHNARPYVLYLEKANLRDRLKLSDEHRHERVLELKMKTRNGVTGNTHGFALFVATKGELRGVPLRIEDKPRWWLKVRQDLNEEHPPSNEVVETNR